MNLIFASLSLSVPLFHYIVSPVADMREKPSRDSEIVSQAYYSEEIKVIEEVEDWVKIETITDHYQGWVQNHSFCARKESFTSNPSALIAKVNRCAAHIYHAPDIIYGPLLTLPFDGKLKVARSEDEMDNRWIKVILIDDREAYVQRGDVTMEELELSAQEICALSKQFIGLPYTWGGRSSFGYDCSGFVQMLYRQMGIFLPRDAKDQINWPGFVETTLESLMPGDLIFFGLEESKIRHVGMSVGGLLFIHPSTAENAPYIRVSDLSNPEWNGFGRYKFRTYRTLKFKLGVE